MSNQKIGNLIISNINFIKKICKTRSEKKRKAYLKGATKEELLSLIEICSNILCSNFKLKPDQKKKLAPYANFIRKLGRVRSEKSARVIVQKGNGFIFSVLLTPVLAEAVKYSVKYLTKKFAT